MNLGDSERKESRVDVMYLVKMSEACRAIIFLNSLFT